MNIENLSRTSNIFKALSSPIRIRMLKLVDETRRPLHIKAVAESLKMNYAAIYRHVKVLQKSGLIEVYEVGRSRVLNIINKEMIRQLMIIANKEMQ